MNYNKFYELNKGLKDYEDMLYMSSCEHIIISNSTFSWFSAYLSRNKNNTLDLLQENFYSWFLEGKLKNFEHIKKLDKNYI